MKDKKELKILVVSDIHDNIENVKKLVEMYKDSKYDYVFCCGDVVNLPVNRNEDKELSDKYSKILKNIFLELEKIAPIYWVPGNHEPYFYFNEKTEEVTQKSKNLHKKIQKLDDKLYIVGLGGSIPILTGGKWKENYTYFKNVDFEKDFKYKGYPYNSSDNYNKSDELYIKDLNEAIDKAKKEGGEDTQIIFLTHLGPYYALTNVMVEFGEVLYLGSKKFGDVFEKENGAFLDIHGHSHTAEGFISLKINKHVLNPGANLNKHYATLELRKSSQGKWSVSSVTLSYLE